MPDVWYISLPRAARSNQLGAFLCLSSASDVNISKFLNRILGMEVRLQNALFQFFSDTMNSLIAAAKRQGKWDLGILGTYLFFNRSFSPQHSRCVLLL